MKAGDKVTIRDGSYSLTLVDGKLKHTFINRPSIRGQHWEIVEVGCVLPSEKQSTGQRRGECLNDTIINGPDGVVFVHSKFLAPVDVSKKSKQEIREMSEFKVMRQSHPDGPWMIKNDVTDYLHSDGSIYRHCLEYFPTDKQAQAVLDKFRPEHEWVHGDVFRRKNGTVMMVLDPLSNSSKRSVFCVDHQPYAVGPLSCLKDATFLFNIKTVIKDWPDA